MFNKYFKKNNEKEIISWAMYDWANSSFATTIMAGFFPIFFKQYWSNGTDPVGSTARLGFANSIAGIIMVLIAPVLGAIADKGHAKKKFLIFFTYFGIIMIFSMYSVYKGEWFLALLLFILSMVGFNAGIIFYDSLITLVSTDENNDFVSSLGYSLGYLGGGILFALNVWMTLSPGTFGLASTEQAVKTSFLTVGIWWAVFSLPVMIFVKEEPKTDKVSYFNIIKQGFIQLRDTFHQIRHLKSIFLFLFAYWFYIDGVDTIICMAIDYGMSIGINSNDLILALLITQFIGFPAAICFSYLSNKIGTKQAIFTAIAVYFVVCIWGAFIKDKSEFYILAGLIGLVQGGIQALSRSYYARMIPVEKSAEYFGFFNMIGKFATVIGPVLMSMVGLIMKSHGYSNNSASRASISSITLLFLIGGIILYFVDENKAKEEIKYLS